jgi:hypothetical protein
VLKEAGWRLILPEIRNIVKEEISAALAPVQVELKSVNLRIDEMDKRLSNQILEMDKRLSSQMSDLRESVNVAQRIAVLEAQVKELRKE